MTISCLLPNYLQKLSPYESSREGAKPGMIWLNANEYPISSDFKMCFETLNRYPEVQPSLFRQRYADYVGLKPEQLIVTRGADEAIELLIRTFCTPFKDQVLYAEPTYSMYGISAKTCGALTTIVSATTNLRSDIDALIQKAADPSLSLKIVFVCNPNNPTGEVIEGKKIIELLQVTQNAIVVVDEAYIEFSPEDSVVNLIDKYPNLVVIRTLSKAFALAGLRCGVILAQTPMINALRKVLAPYPVPQPVAAIAERALSAEGIVAMKRRVAIISQNRYYLCEALKNIRGINQIYSGKTNFVLFALQNARNVYRELWQAGIAIREPSVGENVLRVSVGTIDECSAFVRQLSLILREG